MSTYSGSMRDGMKRDRDEEATGAVQKGGSRDCTRNKMVLRSLEQTMREKYFSSRERQLEKPTSGALAAKGKSQG